MQKVSDGTPAPRWGAIQVPRQEGVRGNMPTYVILGNFTQEGIENIKDSPKRLADNAKLAKSLGGEMKAFYYTLGRYDFVAITEGPDNETLMKGMLIIGSKGSVRTETLVAIPAEKVTEIIKELP
jgi:uncharacterized protein with GYD domain